MFGSTEAQTTPFTVTAEDGITQQTYSVRHIAETEDWDYEGKPFFTEISENTSSSVNFASAFVSAKVYDLAGKLILETMHEGKTIDLSPLKNGRNLCFAINWVIVVVQISDPIVAHKKKRNCLREVTDKT